jgi:LuxR family glucitol operon transcriptional activator
MSFSATRLTCFALLSAMEEDMRNSIEATSGEVAIEQALPQDRAERAQARRVRDGLTAAKSLTGLLAYLDFADSFELLMSDKGKLETSLVESLKLISPHFERVIAIRNRVAHTRPMDIDDSANLLDLASEIMKLASSHWPTVDETMSRLRADPSYVLGLTVRLPHDPDTGPQHNLPVPDFDETGFFGRHEQLRRIKRAIKGAYPVVSVLGDGGIGKTSIALKAAYDLLEDPAQPFEAIVWVTAKATILTSNEIHRISGAIETSLGLFAHAADELAGGIDGDDPVEEVLAYLETFRVLLILDNLETVLDARLRSFLLDLPMGSKVLITSRIGLGIENPVQLDPLTTDESTRLLRTLARIRNVKQLTSLPQETVTDLATKMGGHPAFIRWFVAGVQSGRRPEELLSNNELLLDFCMSNVYEYLRPDARSVVRSMQVLPGGRNQPELAFLNDFTAASIQSALLELLTTNFVQMSSRPSGQSLDTVYQLSDFGKQYLDKHHPVSHADRERLLAKSRELRDLGLQLSADSTASPYSAETVNVRGIGDVHVARLLRQALRLAASDPNAALKGCQEAQVLAPSYYEAWRVEASVRAVMPDHAGALIAYERALELAPDSPTLHYQFGNFLLNEAGDPQRALEVLQAGARVDDSSPQLTGQIAWAHYCLGGYDRALDTCGHMLGLPDSSQNDMQAAVLVGITSADAGMRHYLSRGRYDQAAELLEAATEFVYRARIDLVRDESFDRLIFLQANADELIQGAEDFIASKARDLQQRLRAREREAAPILVRRIGYLKALVAEKYYGFVRADASDYFVHYRDLVEPQDWELLSDGVACAFEPSETDRGLRAKNLRVLP